MRFKLKEDEILEFLDLNFPQQTFEKGRLLIGQNMRQPLHVYYFGKKFLALLNVNFNTFEYIKVDEVDYNDIKKITLKDGLLFKKMFIETESSPDSCVKCYTMFLPFLLIKIDVFS